MKRELPEILTKREENDLLGLFNTRYYTSHRNMLIIKLALATGMRISELIKLKFRDITPSEGVFKIHIKQGKGKKDRMIFISPEMYKALYELHEKHDVISPYVFSTHQKKPMQDHYLRRMIKEKGVKAGIPRIHFHLLRHTYLTRTFDKTKDIRVVQEIAGHSSITTTMIYTHISGEAIRAAMTE
jgi:integrase/recombinase XerD